MNDAVIVFIFILLAHILRNSLSKQGNKRVQQLKNYAKILSAEVKNYQANSTFLQKTLLEREIIQVKKEISELGSKYFREFI